MIVYHGGMSEEQLQHALVPFYTSKIGGSGIGLTLCRDIIEAHGGNISLRNQAPGLEVCLLLPRNTATSTIYTDGTIWRQLNN